MDKILGLILLSFITISVLLVPFINLLYRIKFQRQNQKTRDLFLERTPIFDKLHAHKTGTPVGGGALIVFVVSLLYLILINVWPHIGVERTYNYDFKREVQIILFTFISFGVLGLYDDIRKTFGLQLTKFWGLRFRHKFLFQLILATVIASMLYFTLGIHVVNIRYLDIIDLGIFYIPFAAFVIISFANAVNIADGLDGLASGLMVICLMAFLVISAAIIDTTLAAFLGVLIGALIAFLYFNIWPARVWLGDVGALSLGAVLAVSGLLLGKPLALVIIGGVFVIEVTSSLLQIGSKKLRGRKLFPVAPIHLWFQNIGWPESKIVFRFWLAQIILALFGVWISLQK